MTTASDPTLLTLVGRLSHLLGTLANRFRLGGPSVPPDDVYDPHSRTADLLRTPLTSIRSFSEIVLHNPNLSPEQRAQFLGIVVAESERLERAIDSVLREEKLERSDKAA